MKPNKIDYFEAGNDAQFNQIGARDEKIKLLTNFLIKTDFEFSIEQWNEAKVVKLDKDKDIFIIFNDAGGISLEQIEEQNK